MKTILLWDPRFPDRSPSRYTFDDRLASAVVRSGIAAAANPAEAGVLNAGGPLDPATLTPVVVQHGINGDQLARILLPISVVMVGASLGLLASIGIGIGIDLPFPIPVPLPSVRQLLVPTVQPSAAADVTSAAFRVTLAEDLRLPENGYLGFGLRIERATDAAFTQGYASQMVLINTPMMTEEGLADFAILRGLSENTIYYFQFSVVPPAQSDFETSPGTVQEVAIGAVPTSTFAADLPAGYTGSNGGRTATGGAGSGDRVAKTATSHSGTSGRFVLEARRDAEGEPRFALGVIAAEASTVKPFGGSTSAIVYFNLDGTGYVLSNGGGGPYAFDTDSGITLAAGVYQLLVDCAENTVTGFRGSKRGVPISMSGDLAGAVKHGFMQLGFKAATDTEPAAADVGTWTNSGVRVANSEAWL